MLFTKRFSSVLVLETPSIYKDWHKANNQLWLNQSFTEAPSGAHKIPIVNIAAISKATFLALSRRFVKAIIGPLLSHFLFISRTESTNYQQRKEYRETDYKKTNSTRSKKWSQKISRSSSAMSWSKKLPTERGKTLPKTPTPPPPPVGFWGHYKLSFKLSLLWKVWTQESFQK